MKKERTLAFQLSKKMTAEDLANVSAAGMSQSWTAHASYRGQEWDGDMDASIDF